jgi:hypothetical protein
MLTLLRLLLLYYDKSCTGMNPQMMMGMMRPGMPMPGPGMMPGVNPNLAQHPAFAAAYQQQLLQQQLMQQQMAMQVSEPVGRLVRAHTTPWAVQGHRLLLPLGLLNTHQPPDMCSTHAPVPPGLSTAR